MDEVCRQIKTKFNIDPQKINLVSGAGVNINDVSKAYVDLQDNSLRQQINTINNDLLIQIGNEKTERINNDNSILQVLADLDDKKQDKLIAGEQINITADNIISAVIADANETTKGLIRIATAEEVTAGDLDNAAITPKTLANTMAPIKAIVNVDTKEFLGTANAAKKLDTARTIDLAGAVTGNVLFDGASNVSINAVLTSFDASKIASGTIDIARLPAGALDRLIQVADKIRRLALTTAQVQQGDTVQEIDTGLMFRVIDDSKLNSDSGYVEYTAGRAASVPWAGITEKPTTLAKYGIVDAKIVNGTITLGGSSIKPLTTHQDISNKADLNSPTFTGIPTAPTATADNSSAQLATTAFVKTAVGKVSDRVNDYLPLKGGTMSGDIDMGMKSIKNVGLPVSDTDATNKKYVDDRIKENQTITGNAGSADKLKTARKINGTLFDGTKDIEFGRLTSVFISANTDLDALTYPGMYCCLSNSTAATLINSPTVNAFSLFVERHAGYKQTLTEYMISKPTTYSRNLYNGVWGSWYKNIDSNNMPEQTVEIAKKWKISNGNEGLFDLSDFTSTNIHFGWRGLEEKTNSIAEYIFWNGKRSSTTGGKMANVKATTFIGNLAGNASTASKLADTRILSSTNLDTLINFATYRCDAGDIAATLLNCPTTKAFSLFVERHYGYKQTLTESSPDNPKTWYRNSGDGVAGSSGWGKWVQIIDSNALAPQLEVKQDKLIAGSNITITNNTISAAGGAKEKKYIDLGEARYGDVDINISKYDIFSIDSARRINPKIIIDTSETRTVLEWVFIIKNSNGGIIEWENNILWEGGVAPTLTTSDVIEFFSYNKGNTWYASKKTDFLNIYDGTWTYQLSNDKAVLKYLGDGTKTIVIPGIVNSYKTAVNGSTFYGINDYIADASAVDFSDITRGYGFFSKNWGTGFAATAREIMGINLPNVNNLGRAFSDNKYLLNGGTIKVGTSLDATEGMFDSCSKLITGAVINTVTVRDFHQMYANCIALTTVPELNTSKGTIMRNMFDNCRSLPTTFPWSIDLSSMTPALASNRDGLTSMFSGSSVKTVRFKNVQAGTEQYLTAAVLGSQLTSIIIDNKI